MNPWIRIILAALVWVVSWPVLVLLIAFLFDEFGPPTEAEGGIVAVIFAAPLTIVSVLVFLFVTRPAPDYRR